MEHKLIRFIRKNFITGMAVAFPLFVTLYIIYFIIRFFDGLIGQGVDVFTRHYFDVTLPGISVIVAFLSVVLIGFAYNYFLGYKIWPLFEQILYKIPVVSNIYPSTKELSQFLFSSGKANRKFQKAVSVEFPMKGIYSVGFITNDQVNELQENKDQDLVSVFVPLAPTPVTGHILLVPQERVRELDMSVDRAVKFIVSGGVVLPPKNKKRK